jgi:hypothetical protein
MSEKVGLYREKVCYVCLHKEDKKGKNGHRSRGMYCHSGMLAMVELFIMFSDRV